MRDASRSTLLTVEDVVAMADPGYRFELVRGRIVLSTPRPFRYGLVCGRVLMAMTSFVRSHRVGRLSCGSGVITHRDPDSLRAVDLSYYSFARLPRKIVPDPYPDIAPDLAVEVRSPTDRNARVVERISEYFDAGMLAACVVDPDCETVTVYRPDAPDMPLSAGDELALPDILPGFACPVAEFFRDPRRDSPGDFAPLDRNA